MHSCPALRISSSNNDVWFAKSSCWLRSRAIQHLLFSNGHTSLHFALSPFTSNPHSSRTCCNPIGWPFGSFIGWGFPRSSTTGLFIGMTVSLWCRCLPPFDLFISKACKASGPSDVCADDWSKINRAWQPGCAFSKIWIAHLTWARSCSWSHQASPFVPGYIIWCASSTISPLALNRTRRPDTSVTKSDTWMSRPRPFLRNTFSPSRSLQTICKSHTLLSFNILTIMRVHTH